MIPKQIQGERITGEWYDRGKAQQHEKSRKLIRWVKDNK